MSALRRLPALTPDSMGLAPRAKLEQAVELAGPYREERMRALTAGVDAFRRHRDLPNRLRVDVATATDALALLPYLTAVSGQWLLLFGGRHRRLPADPNLLRVVARLGTDTERVARDLGAVLTRMAAGSAVSLASRPCDLSRVGSPVPCVSFEI